jgi:diguanylate cyclase (GGDEF)-like protein
MGSALRVAGVGGVAFGVTQGGKWALLAAAGGFVLAFGLTRKTIRRLLERTGRAAPPLDFSHTVDLLRRAHGATAGWMVGLQDGEVQVTGGVDIGRDLLRRGAAVVHLAAVDGRTHVARELEGTYVAVGDFPYGAGLLLAQRDAAPAIAEAAAEDLRRLVASMRLAEMEVPEAQSGLVARHLALIASGAQTLDGVAKAGAELAQQLSQRGAAVVIQNPATLTAHVHAVSTAADKRLQGVSLKPEAPVVRAVNQGVPVVTQGVEDIFGPGVPERRRQDRAGTAYPLVDGNHAIGALVLVGSPLEPDNPRAERITRLVAELGPRLAAARAVHEAELRAVRDPLTGLSNRRELERVMGVFREETTQQPEAASVVYVDLDRFKQLNDTLGHAAGDAALRHVATVLQVQLRDGDLVARIGGEEFAIWLPRATLKVAVEVAERVRAAVEGTAWYWNGTAYRLTTSCGIASFPESVNAVDNLPGAAEAALYRAKQAGRNRVEIATRAG